MFTRRRWLGTGGIAAAALASRHGYGEPAPPIASPDEAVNVFDFEPLAESAMRPAHWTYLDMGVEGEVGKPHHRTDADHGVLDRLDQGTVHP